MQTVSDGVSFKKFEYIHVYQFIILLKKIGGFPGILPIYKLAECAQEISQVFPLSKSEDTKHWTADGKIWLTIVRNSLVY